MITVTINQSKFTLTPETIADELARMNNEDQANFINCFGRALLVRCGSEHRRQMQICTVADHLDDDGRAVVQDASAFVDMDETGKIRG